MKRDTLALSMVRAASPFASPPRVLVVADDETAGSAVSLAETLEALGADAEVRFGQLSSHDHPDAVIVAEARGYSIRRHHPILEKLRIGASR